MGFSLPGETCLQQRQQSTRAPVQGTSELPLEHCAAVTFPSACGRLIQATWMIKGYGQLIFLY